MSTEVHVRQLGDGSTRPERLAANGQQHPRETVRRCWSCTKVLLFMYEMHGRIEIICRRCKKQNVITGDDPNADEALSKYLFEHYRPDIVQNRGALAVRGIVDRLRPSEEEIVSMMETRWDAARRTRIRAQAELAVGLRFDVFARDGFRCRYCGRSPADGAVLHADHVTPASKGGATIVDNLVTACLDCNLGKSDKSLDVAPP